MYNFLNVAFDEQTGKLSFSDGYTCDASDEEKSFFKYRKKLKAIKENNKYKIIRWADIHRHSGYSLLDGCISLEDMVAHTEFSGAVTDHGNMFAALNYYKLMKKAGKLPIIGEEFYCETFNGEKKLNHLILLAKNEVGYKNLIKLSSMSFDNFYYKPHISYEMLKEYSEGLICTSACLGGELSQALKNKEKDKVLSIINWFKEVFKDDYYVEIQRHNLKDEKIVNPYLISLSKKYGIKLVAATDSHYVSKEDVDTHEIILCIGTKTLLSDKDRMSFEGTGYHLHAADEMDELFKDIPEALDSTLEIMEKCKNLVIETGNHYLPNFPIPAGFSDINEYFRKVSRNGFKERFKEKFTILDEDSPEVKKEKEKNKKKYWERWKFEMSVIEQMGFEGYFLIVWDFLKFCRDNDIPIGPGRGSGAGSLVLYCLRITDYDPIEYGLLFERFLNPDRISLPDIDSDISEEKRELVIDYVREKYGKDNVSQIITFGRLAAKAAVKDVGRVLGIPAKDVLKITKSIPDTPGIKLKDALKQSTEFKKFYNDNPLYKKVIDVAMKIEGLPRQTGVHACFDANTLVKTENGFIKIKDVKVGDKVLTHKNRWKPVVNTIITETNTEMTIYSSAAMPIKCTKNHPFLIRRALYKNGKKVGYTKPEWINAEHLSVGDYVLSINNSEFLWHKVKKIETDFVNCKPMYNLTVADDHSYTANNVVVHNCGILIGQKPITEYCPTAKVLDEQTQKHTTTSQFTGPECEEVGLVKFDFLGLRTLDVEASAVKQINETENLDLTVDDIPLYDPKVYKFLCKGQTEGVFQFESPGMTKLLKQMFSDVKVRTDTEEKGKEYFERLIAAVSLYRPGPIDEIPNYLKAMKSGLITYDHPKLESILSSTYGIFVYQGATSS